MSKTNRKNKFILNTSGDVVRAAVKWKKARDEVSVKGMMAQLETEEFLAEIITAYLKNK